jgi:hypothetical protein
MPVKPAYKISDLVRRVPQRRQFLPGTKSQSLVTLGQV